MLISKFATSTKWAQYSMYKAQYKGSGDCQEHNFGTSVQGVKCQVLITVNCTRRQVKFLCTKDGC